MNTILTREPTAKAATAGHQVRVESKGEHARAASDRQGTLYIVLGTAAAYALWEFIAHRYLMFLPMGLWHWLSAGVGTVLALAITALSTRTIVQQQRELESLSRLKEDLTSMVVHDFRSPLAAMVGSLETIRCGVVGEVPERFAEMVDMALKNTYSLAAQVNDMLDIARMEAGEPILRLEETDAWSMFYDPIRTLQTLADERGVHLSAEVDPEIPSLFVDGPKLQRVIVNLLDNAIKFTPPGGTVSLRAGWFALERRLSIQVTDTGEGIPSEDLPRIFEKFAQARNGKIRSRASSGLGLAFCRIVVEAHGGSIRVDSRTGEGATFTVEIPA